jgi:hypothetical protein
VFHEGRQIENSRDINNTDRTYRLTVMITDRRHGHGNAKVCTTGGCNLDQLVCPYCINENRAIVMTINYPALFNTDTIAIPRFCRHRKTMNELVNRKDNRFEIIRLGAAGQGVLVHRYNLIVWSFSIYKNITDEIPPF